VSTAGRGEPSADRLTGQGPWSHSQGHLMHMASHTFVRLGRYHDGIQSNVRAFAADLEDVEQCRKPYLPEHNLEMLIYSATLGGEVMLNLHTGMLSSENHLYMHATLQSIRWHVRLLLLLHLHLMGQQFILVRQSKQQLLAVPHLAINQQATTLSLATTDVSWMQVGQALRYAKAIRGQPDDSSLGMAGLGGWTPLLLVQSVYGLWDGILQSPAPPADARGPCPAQGYEYAVTVFHYTRTLAHAASCGAIPDSLACSQAVEELHQLRVCPLLPLQHSQFPRQARSHDIAACCCSLCLCCAGSCLLISSMFTSRHSKSGGVCIISVVSLLHCICMSPHQSWQHARHVSARR